MLVVGDQAPHEDAVVSSGFRGSEGMLGVLPTLGPPKQWILPSSKLENSGTGEITLGP